MDKMIFEILDETAKCRTKPEKITNLRKYDSPALRMVLNYALNPNCRMYRNTVPPVKLDEAPTGLSFQTLYNVHKQLYIFLAPDQEAAMTGKNPTNLQRKDQILMQTLEAMDHNDAKVLMSLITKTFGKQYNLTKQIVDEAFPGLIR